MKKKSLQLYCFGLILTLTLVCSACGQSEKEKAFNSLVEIPVDQMNRELRISLLKNLNTLKVGELVNLEVENNTDNKIIFPSDYGIRMFTYRESNWIEVGNIMEYYPPGEGQITPKKDGDLPGVLISVLPDIQEATSPVDLRIVMIGSIAKNDESTDEKVGAFIDVILEP